MNPSILPILMIATFLLSLLVLIMLILSSKALKKKSYSADIHEDMNKIKEQINEESFL